MPRFAEPIPNVTVSIGRDALLACVVDNLRGFKVRKLEHCGCANLQLILKIILQGLLFWAEVPVNVFPSFKQQNIILSNGTLQSLKPPKTGGFAPLNTRGQQRKTFNWILK